jgi:hypothetical protein
MRFEVGSQGALDAIVSALRSFQFPGKVRLLERLVPKSGQRRARFLANMNLDLSEHIHEPKETEWVTRWLQLGMTVADVGPNVGYYTLLAASRVGRRGQSAGR